MNNRDFDKASKFGASGHQIITSVSAEPRKNLEFQTGRTENFQGPPYLPRNFNAEPENLGYTVDILLHAKLHGETIIPSLAKIEQRENGEYKWRSIKLNPIQAQSGAYGGRGPIATISENWHRGNMHGTNGGILMPRGFKENLPKYKAWWDFQVKANIDMLERYSQQGIYRRILDNQDSFKFHVSEKGGFPSHSVEDYLTEFYNPLVNVFRLNRGWMEFFNHTEKLRNIYYSDVNVVKSGKAPWIILITPEVETNINLYKQENLLYLFKGDVNSPKTPGGVTVYDYNTTNIMKNGVYPVPNFIDINTILGKNVFTANFEFAWVHRFSPHNFILKSKPFLIDDSVRKKSYDIEINNDYFKTTDDRIGYKEAVITAINNINLNDLGLGNDNNQINLGQVCEYFFVCKDRKLTMKDYFDNLLKQIGVWSLKEINLHDVILTGEIKEFKYTEQKIKFFGYKDKISKFLKIHERFGQELVFDIMKYLNLDVSIHVKECIGFRDDLDDEEVGDNPIPERFSAVRGDGILKVLMNMNDMGLDLPFGVLLFKRVIIECDITARVRKHGITQFQSKVMTMASQQFNTGETHYSLHKRFGEHMNDFRDSMTYEKTFMRKVISGGKNILFHEEDQDNMENLDEMEHYPVKFVFKTGDLFPKAVKMKYVLNRDGKMINRMGFDTEALYEDQVKLLRKKDKNPYFEPCFRNNNNYNFKEIMQRRRNKSVYSLDKKREYVEETNHWFGRTKYVCTEKIDNEVGPCERNPTWWTNEQPRIHIKTD